MVCRGDGQAMKTLQLLGTGCPKCKQLAAATEAAATALGLQFQADQLQLTPEQMAEACKLGECK